MRLFCKTGLVVSCLTMAGACFAQTTQPRAAGDGPPFPRIANCYGARLGPDTSDAELNLLARYDLLIGGTYCNWSNPEQVAKFRRNLTHLRQKNPHIIVLEFSSSAPYLAEWETHEGFPDDGWLLTPEGGKIAGWPGSYMINLTHPQVVSWQAGRSYDGIFKRGHHGTFIDCMGPRFDWWACEIATGKEYQIDADRDGEPDPRQRLDRAWRKAKLQIAQQVRDRIGADGILMANQAGRETHEVVNGILLEDYLDYVLDKDRDWREVLDDYLFWTTTLHRPNVTTIVSSSGVQPPFHPRKNLSTREQEALQARGRALHQRMRFGLATTLMGDGYFAYDLHTRWRGQHWWYPEYDTPLGYPKGPASQMPNGTWRRQFDGGMVVVNPTARPATVSGKGFQRDVSTGREAETLVIPPKDGRILVPAERPAKVESVMPVTVGPKDVVCESFLGFGAEWDPTFWHERNLKLGVTEQDFQQVLDRLRYMRMPIVRMMMLSRWCTPAGDGKYDWDTPEMRSLYRHLDACQELGITVVLTDWGCVTWAKVPGFAGTDDPKYAEAIGTYMDYLINTKGYSCIRYFVLVNEPNFEGGGWDAWKKGIENVARVFAERGLDKQVTLTGSDESGDEKWHRRAVKEVGHLLGAYDVHCYAADRNVRAGQLERFFARHRQYCLEKDPGAAGKPFIIGEAGLNDGAKHPYGNENIDTRSYGLFMADYAVQAARAGAASVLAWMLDDSSHEGFFWGLWPGKQGGFELRPWFYTWSLLCRYVPAGATIYRPSSESSTFRALAARVSDPQPDTPDVLSETPGEAWTFVLVNRGRHDVRAKLSVEGGVRAMFRKYFYSHDLWVVDPMGFPRPVGIVPLDLAAGAVVVCPAQSVVLLSSLPW